MRGAVRRAWWGCAETVGSNVTEAYRAVGCRAVGCRAFCCRAVRCRAVGCRVVGILRHRTAIHLVLQVADDLVKGRLKDVNLA